MGLLWENYLEFMVVKTLGLDTGSHTAMKYSTTPLMDELWHTHVLCTLRYMEFMELVKKVNPLVDFLHHTLHLSNSSEVEKEQRREATADAYRSDDLTYPIHIRTLTGKLTVVVVDVMSCSS